MPDTKPEQSLIPVETGFTNLVPSEEQVKEASRRLNAGEGAALMGDVATIGRTSRSKGMRDVARGIAVLEINTLRGLHATLDRHIERLNNMRPTKAILQQIQSLILSKVKVSEAIERHNARILAAEGTLAGLPDTNEDPAPVNASFGAGQKVGPGQTVIYAQSVSMGTNEAKTPPPGK